MKKALFIFILVILSMFTVCAEDFYFKVNSNSKLDVPCFNDGGACSAVTTCNISINSPTNLLYNNVEMDQNGYIYSFNFTPTEIGTYKANIICLDGTESGSNSFNFEVNNAGKERENSGFLITFLIFFALIITGLTVMMFSNRIYLWASVLLPVNAGIYGFLFFNLYLFSMVLTNLYFTLYIISMIIFVVLLLFVVYELIFQLLSSLNKKRKSTFEDSL